MGSPLAFALGKSPGATLLPWEASDLPLARVSLSTFGTAQTSPSDFLLFVPDLWFSAVQLGEAKVKGEVLDQIRHCE